MLFFYFTPWLYLCFLLVKQSVTCLNPNFNLSMSVDRQEQMLTYTSFHIWRRKSQERPQFQHCQKSLKEDLESTHFCGLRGAAEWMWSQHGMKWNAPILQELHCSNPALQWVSCFPQDFNRNNADEYLDEDSTFHCLFFSRSIKLTTYGIYVNCIQLLRSRQTAAFPVQDLGDL